MLPAMASRTNSPTRDRGDDVVRALQHERRDRDTCARSARLSERNVAVGEPAGDRRVGAAEALGQLGAELRAVGVPHDHRRHRARPAEVVALERVEQLVDVRLAEPARRSRRRRCSGARGRPGRARRSARAPRSTASTPIIADTEWPTKIDVVQVELAADLEDVVGVAVERRVALPGRRRRGRIRPAPTWSKQDDPEVGPRTRGRRTATCSGRSRSRGRTSSGRPSAGPVIRTLYRSTTLTGGEYQPSDSGGPGGRDRRMLVFADRFGR